MTLRKMRIAAAQKSRKRVVRRPFGCFERLETRRLLAIDFAQYADSPGCPFVNTTFLQDDDMTSLDVLILIDKYQRAGGAAPVNPFQDSAMSLDPDGDGLLTPKDIRYGIDYLTNLGTGQYDPLWCKPATVDFTQHSQPSIDTLLPGETKSGFEFSVAEGGRDVVFNQLGLTVTDPAMSVYDVSADLFVDSNHDGEINPETDTLLANGYSPDGRRVEFNFHHDLPIIPQRFGVLVTGSRSYSGSEFQLDWDFESGGGPFVATDKVNGSEVEQWGIGHANSTRFSLIPHGTVIVEQGLEPLRSHQIVAGTISERPVASLEIVALDEPAEVRVVPVLARGEAVEAVDHLRVFRDGEATEFAIATDFTCEQPIPEGYDGQFCLTLYDSLIVGENEQVKLNFHALTDPNFVVDITGPVEFVIDGDVRPPEVIGWHSSDVYGRDGVVFEASTVFDFPAQEIVQAKIEHIEPIGPEDGSLVSPGYRDIGGFEFFVGHHQNHNEGEVQAFLPALTVDVVHPNVELDLSDAWLFNDRDITNHALPESIVEVGPGLTRLTYVGLGDAFVNHAGSQESIPLVVNTNIIRKTDPGQPGSVRMDLNLDDNTWAAGVDEAFADEHPFDLTETVIRGNTIDVG